MCGAEAIIVADREGCRGDAARALGVAMFELSGGAGVAGQRWGLLWGASLQEDESEAHRLFAEVRGAPPPPRAAFAGHRALLMLDRRSEEHTSELQSLMRISYAVFCLKKKKTQQTSYQNLCMSNTIR